MSHDDDSYAIAIDPSWDAHLRRHLSAWAAYVRDQTITAIEEQAEPTKEDAEVLGLLRLLGTENATPQAYAVWHGLCIGLAHSGNACALAAAASAAHVARQQGTTLPGWLELATSLTQEDPS